VDAAGAAWGLGFIGYKDNEAGKVGGWVRGGWKSGLTPMLPVLLPCHALGKQGSNVPGMV
jgi:hypothetical protein